MAGLMQSWFVKFEMSNFLSELALYNFINELLNDLLV